MPVCFIYSALNSYKCGSKSKHKYALRCLLDIWYLWLSSFQGRDTKLNRFFAKNQHYVLGLEKLLSHQLLGSQYVHSLAKSLSNIYKPSFVNFTTHLVIFYSYLEQNSSFSVKCQSLMNDNVKNKPKQQPFLRGLGKFFTNTNWLEETFLYWICLNLCGTCIYGPKSCSQIIETVGSQTHQSNDYSKSSKYEYHISSYSFCP